MANKFKEIEGEKYSKTIYFPSLKETFEKINELTTKINIDFVNLIRSHSESNQIEIKLKKTKSQVIKVGKLDNAKVKVSILKWNNDETIDLNCLLEKKELAEEPKRLPSESQHEFSNSKSENSQHGNDEKKSKLEDKTFSEFLNEDSSKMDFSFQAFLEQLKPNDQKENWINNSETLVKIAEPFSVMESSYFPEASNKKVEPQKNKKEKAETRLNTKSIERYIQENKSKLTNLDLCILNSMAKCYTNGNREKSRFEFANKSNQSKTILEKYSTMNNLISSFFKEETEVLKFDPSRIRPKTEERFYRLFNQSYTLERLE